MASLPWLPRPPAEFRVACRALDPAQPDVGSRIQFLAGHALEATQATHLSNAIRRCVVAGARVWPLQPFRLGVLSGATVDLLADVLPAAAARHGVALSLTTTPYGQMVQQAMVADSEIYRTPLDAVLVLADQRWLQLERGCAPHLAHATVAAALDPLRSIVDHLKANRGGAAILPTIPAAPERMIGSFERRLPGSPPWLVEEVNRGVIALAEESGSYLLDLEALAARVGLDQWFDPVQWGLYKLPFAADLNTLVADAIGRLLGAIRGASRKCLVLDLDNTVWGGVVGDDGVASLRLGQGGAEGEAFLAVQQIALDLRAQGVLLAVCSKNTEAVARSAFREHPDMLLKETHVSCFQANWADKPTNLEAIAGCLGIGLDALVLLDDNPAERAQVRAALPMVAVPELPADPSWYPRYLSAAGYFEAVAFSSEDAIRPAAYAADASRAEVMANTRELGDYLSALEMRIAFAPFDAARRERIAQLINKSNQFNLTSRRYTSSQVADLERDADVYTLQVRLSDRFSDMGMIGVIIARTEGALGAGVRAWMIDTWLMSCRVLGRQVEEAMLRELIRVASIRGVNALIGVYRRTAKNGMVAEHYPKLGFTLSEDRGDERIYRLDLPGVAMASLPFIVDHPSSPTRKTAPAP